jgi:hypothetical protein
MIQVKIIKYDWDEDYVNKVLHNLQNDNYEIIDIKVNAIRDVDFLYTIIYKEKE